jgi:hypothetical protein
MFFAYHSGQATIFCSLREQNNIFLAGGEEYAEVDLEIFKKHFAGFAPLRE